MAKKKISKRSTKNNTTRKNRPNPEDQKIFAFLATFLSIIGFLIAIIAKKDDDYVMFYAKTSLVIFIMAIISGVFIEIFRPIIIIGFIMNLSLSVLMFALWVISWIYALSGKKIDIPIVEYFVKKIDL